MPLLHTTRLVQLLIHINTSWPLSPIYCSAHFSVLPTLYTPDSFCVPCPFHILHQLPLETQVHKQSTSSDGSPFNITCIRPPLPYLEHLITLLLPTLTLSFLLLHILLNSLTSLQNFSCESATSAVSFANNSWFISNLTPLEPHHPYIN